MAMSTTILIQVTCHTSAAHLVHGRQLAVENLSKTVSITITGLQLTDYGHKTSNWPSKYSNDRSNCI